MDRAQANTSRRETVPLRVHLREPSEWVNQRKTPATVAVSWMRYRQRALHVGNRMGTLHWVESLAAKELDRQVLWIPKVPSQLQLIAKIGGTVYHFARV